MVETLLNAELPGDLGSADLLELVEPGAEDAVASALAERQSFAFVVCRDVLRRSPRPLALLADLWRLTEPGGVLLLAAEVLAEPQHSAYARFLPAAGTDAGWIPGRLALRWMVEASGFDVERWLGDPGAAGDSRACLRAVRAAREPARSAP